MDNQTEIERPSINIDIVCVGFGPAAGGFLTTLSKHLARSGRDPKFQSRVSPGLPLQVICYERADDIGFGVSGVVTRARALRASFPNLDLARVPMASPVRHEKMIYLLDPVKASRRSRALRFADRVIRTFKPILNCKENAVELPYLPSFLHKKDGFIFSIGQLNQWVGSQLMAEGAVQIWPATAVSEPLFEGERVVGVRLLDQGTDKLGNPDAGFTAGMDVHALLTVAADGPVGGVGQKLDERFGMPTGHHKRDWAVGMKAVVELPANSALEEGTVLHTFGFPEPEIFGFLYVDGERLASLGIFVPSWFDNPVRTSYRYLQHWMMHPYLWRYLKGGMLRSWGAKSLQESGKRGEPFLVGDGFARIGEGSGSTNVLTGSGVDEAWATGVQLAEGVIELLGEGKPFTKENLEAAYVKRRRASWVEREGKIAEHARDGFQKGFIRGLLGMMLSGLSGGKINFAGTPKRPPKRIPSLEEYYKNRIPRAELYEIKTQCARERVPLHDAFMDYIGWPKIPYDGTLLISHQDALLIGGKVQAPAGFADHVVFLYPYLCESCGTKVCVELCSAQAIMPPDGDGVPRFDREKCIYCGACLWNCAQVHPTDPERGNIDFRVGAGGLHSAIN